MNCYLYFRTEEITINHKNDQLHVWPSGEGTIANSQHTQGENKIIIFLKTFQMIWDQIT